MVIIGPGDGLLLIQHQVITWTNANLLSIEPTKWNFNQNTQDFFQENPIENVVCQLPALLFSNKLNDKQKKITYRKTSNISRTLIGYKIVDNSDVVGASPVGAAPTTSSFST